MDKKQSRVLLIVLALGASVALGVYLYPSTMEVRKQGAGQPLVADAGVPDAAVVSTAQTVTHRPQAAAHFTPDDLAFLDQLRDKFKSALQNKHSRIKAIEQLIAYLMQHYPEDWAERMQAFLDQLFPEVAGELFEQFRQLMHYNDWLRLHRDELNKMSAQDRRQALWDARREAFGADAAEIFAAELRNQRVKESLATLETAYGKTVVEKTAVLLEAVKQAYGDQAEIYIQNRQTELLNSFLDVTAIQNELQAQSSAERNATLRGVRSALGMDQAALDRWGELDRRRDQSWEQGQLYMQERNRIVAQHQGAEQQRLLQQHLERSFGEDAETVRNEEQAGYFRYGHDRRFGRE